MMFYPNAFMEKVLSADLVGIVGFYVPKIRQIDGQLFAAQCPFCSGSTRTMLIERDTGKWYCLSCGEGGNVISFVMKLFSVSFESAVAWIAQTCGIEIPQSVADLAVERNRVKERLLKANRCAATFYWHGLRLEKSGEAMKYLVDRGVSLEYANAFGLGYADRSSNSLRDHLRKNGFTDEELVISGLCCKSDSGKIYDRFRDRIMFPIMDDGNRVIAFGGRILHPVKNKDGKDVPKYLNTPDTPIFDKGSTLYGMNRASKFAFDHLIVCEGYMDVLSMHQAGFPNAVAGLGTALTDRNADVIASRTKTALLCYDMDDAGRNALERAATKLSERGVRMFVPDFRPAKDPDEFLKKEGRDAFVRRLGNATPLAIYEAGRLASNEPNVKEIAEIALKYGWDVDPAAIASVAGISVETLMRATRLIRMDAILGEPLR